MEKVFYYIWPLENRIAPMAEVRTEAGERCSAWLERLCGSIVPEDRERVRKILDPPALFQAAKKGKNLTLSFKRQMEKSLRWHKLWVFPENRENSRCLLIMEDVHREFVHRIRAERNELYLIYRKREELLRERGLDCGMAVIEMGEPHRVMASNGRFLEFLESPNSGEFWNYYQKQIQRTIAEMEARGPEQVRSEPVTGYYNLESMEHSPYRWLKLLGYVTVTASGKWYLYLQYVNISDSGDRKLMSPVSRTKPDYTAEYLFAWDIANDRIELSENWESKYRRTVREEHNRGIEAYIWKDDIPKLWRSLNAILRGKIQEDTLIRFFVQNRERPYVWCNISYIDIFCENGFPVYVVGKVRDISHKLAAIFEDALRRHRLSPMSRQESRRKLDDLLLHSSGRRHAFLSFGLGRVADIDKKNGGAVLIYQHLDELAEMIEPTDMIWVDNGILMLCLEDIENDDYVRERVNRLKKRLEDVSDGTLSANIGISVYPDDGTDYQTLASSAKISTWRKTEGYDILNELYLAGINMEELEKGEQSMSHGLISDIVQEWYQIIRKNSLLERQMELTEAQMMLSQIKPHFIYNVLANIKSLIYKDPDLATEIIVTFTKYLRVQLNALGKGELAPFSEIIDAVDKFIRIEQSRFPEKIQAVYDIRYQDFQMPHFIIQPLVENAIHHGICKRETPGTLTIRSYRDGDNIMVEVEDDGIGFDVNEMDGPDKDHGVGLENVRIRLKYLLNGTLNIVSSKGAGTIAKIRIPKWRNESLCQ